jgi:hypothetical protein
MEPPFLTNKCNGITARILEQRNPENTEEVWNYDTS